MNDINTILKLNGLNALLFGALLVFIPQYVITTLSNTNPAPEILAVGMGVILNLYGLFLLWLGNKEKPNPKLVLLIATVDVAWVLLITGLILSQTWITLINGITITGLLAIVVGWFGWQQWQYYRTGT